MRLMTNHGMVLSFKSAKYSSYMGEIGGAPANPVNRDFHATAPNRLRGHGHHRSSIPAGQGVPVAGHQTAMTACPSPGRRHELPTAARTTA